MSDCKHDINNLQRMRYKQVLICGLCGKTKAEIELEKAERERDEARALLKAHRTGDFSINGIFTSEKCPNCTGQLKDNGQRYHCHMCGREFHYGIVEEGDE